MAEITKPVGRTETREEESFAQGINFYKLFWIFFLAAFIGCAIETIFMLINWGQLQNRSGLLYGSFSLVWGLGAVLFTLLFQRAGGWSGLGLFLVGAVSGAGYEYACSWLQEALFGASFWDYSHLPLNINGRVNLIFSLAWGLAAIVWVRGLYPRLCRLVERIPNRMGKPLTMVVCLLLAADVGVTSMALGRMNARQRDVPPRNAVEVFLDTHFSDQRLHQAFSTLKLVGTAHDRAGLGLLPTGE